MSWSHVKILHGHCVLGVLTGYVVVVCKDLREHRVLGVQTGYSVVAGKDVP